MPFGENPNCAKETKNKEEECTKHTWRPDVTVGPHREHSRVSTGGVKHRSALLLLENACWTAEDKGGNIFEVRTAALCATLTQYGRLARSFTPSAVRLIRAAAFGCYSAHRLP